MDTKWLNDFLALVETRSFTRAAELRFTSQSAFSRRIKSLEDSVGAPLFDRRAFPVALTRAGEAFLTHAKDILAHVERSRDAVRQHSTRATAVTSIATTHSLAGVFVPAWLREIETEAGQIDISMFTMASEECTAALVARNVQFMICYCSRQLPAELDSEEYPSLVIGLDALIAQCAPDDHGNPRYAPDVDEDAPYLAYSETSRLAKVLAVELHGRRDIRLQSPPTFVSSYADVLQSMAVHGYGFAWLLNNETRTELTSRRLVRAAPSDWDVPLEVRIYRSRDDLGERGEQVWRAICEQALAYD